MTEKLFAPGFLRNDKGWIKFPADATLRKQIFSEDTMRHPAKNNLYIIQSVVDYLYKPGDTIMDIMAGTGSTMIACFSGCKVICIDTSPVYADMLMMSALHIKMTQPDADIITLAGDCMDFMPLPVDHILFSPPFGNYLTTTDTDDFKNKSLSTDKLHLMGFAEGKGNVGVVNEFFHFQFMERIFKACYESLSSGGTMTFITRDNVEKKKRNMMTNKYINRAKKAGFYLVEQFKRETPRTGLDCYNAKLGIEQVDDEDIVIMRR